MPLAEQYGRHGCDIPKALRFELNLERREQFTSFHLMFAIYYTDALSTLEKVQKC